MAKILGLGLIMILLVGSAFVSADICYSCAGSSHIVHDDYSSYIITSYGSSDFSGSIISSVSVHSYNSAIWSSCNSCWCDGDDDLDDDGYDEDDDCDDGDADVNPGAIEICGNGIDENCDGVDLECPVIACSKDLDCGVPSCGGVNYCFGGDVFQDYDVPVCRNAGESNSYCSSYVAPWLIWDCEYNCAFGHCIVEPDDDLDDDGYNNVTDCDDSDYYVNPGVAENCLTAYDDNCDGQINEGCVVPCVENVVNGSWSEWENVSDCVDGTFEQMRTRTEYDANSCGTFDDVVHEEMRELACSVAECCDDVDCAIDYYEDGYCSGDDVYKTFHNFSCVGGECFENVSEVFVEGCGDGCSGGECDDDNGKHYVLTRRGGDDESRSVNYIIDSDSVLLESIEISALDNVYLENDVDSFDWSLFLFVALVIGVLFLLVLIFLFVRG